MAWDYDYTVKTTTTHKALSTWCDTVRILPEVATAPTVSTPPVSFRHGAPAPSGQLFYPTGEFFLECFLSYGPTPPTHSDGAAGHVYENRARVLEMFMESRTQIWLGRTAPHQGDVEIPVVVNRDIRTSTPRNKLVVSLRTLDPFWRDQTQTTDTLTATSDSIATGGSAVIGDAIFEVSSSGATACTLTHTDTGDYILIGNILSGTVTLDCAAKTATQGGLPADDHITVGQPWWFQLDAAATENFTLTANSSVTVKWYDKWH